MIFQLLSFIFILAIKISAPVLAALILSTLAMAIMARVAPQLNTFFVLLPMKILVGLLALMFSIPILGHLLKEHFGYLLGSIPQLLAKTFQ
jgi:flagellar biosynthetic protein FliR